MRFQDLNDSKPKQYWKHGRSWSDNSKFGFEWAFPSKSVQLTLSLGGSDESAISTSISLWLFSGYFSWYDYKAANWLQQKTKRKSALYGSGRTIGIRFFDGTAWFDLWEDPMSWDSKDPKWWAFNVNFADILLGKSKYSSEILESREVEVPMPERSYEAKANLTLDTWKRPRWFKTQLKRINIDLDDGIPHQGKGSMSYNCGIDHTSGFSSPAESIADGVGKMVGSVLRTRVKHGGWQDWNFQREAQ